jgi:hypothetical protein
MHTRYQLGCLLPAASQPYDLPLVAFGLQARAALPAVGVNRAAGIDVVLHEEVQAGRLASSITRIPIRPVPGPSAWAATAKPLRPPEADQVRSTRFLRRKALLKLLDSPRIVFHGPNLQVVVG